MAKLKGGSITNFSGSMAEEMERVMDQEMRALKGHGLPAMGRDERRLILVAVARGMLNYLKDHQDEIFTRLYYDPDGSGGQVRADVDHLNFNADKIP